MIRSINQIIESVSHADSLFANLREITPKPDLKGRPLAKIKNGIVLIEVDHDSHSKILLCSTIDDAILRKIYIEHSVSADTATLRSVEFYEGEMTIFDARGDAERASILLVEPGPRAVRTPVSRLEKIVAEAMSHFEGYRTTIQPLCIEREGVVMHRTSEGVRYTDVEGRDLFDRVFVCGEPMREGRAEVATAEGYGLIGKHGEFVLSPNYEELVWDEMTGVCIAMRDGEWNMYDRDGVRLTRQSYEWIGEATDGLFPMVEQGRCGFLSADGCEVIASEWDEASSFDERVARVVRDGATYVIDNKGFVVK